MSPMRSEEELYEAWYALLDLFATVDAVFVEPDAFDQDNMKKSMGRIYRTWKRARSALDPEFDPKNYDFKEVRPRKWLPSYVRKRRDS